MQNMSDGLFREGYFRQREQNEQERFELHAYKMDFRKQLARDVLLHFLREPPESGMTFEDVMDAAISVADGMIERLQRPVQKKSAFQSEANQGK